MDQWGRLSLISATILVVSCLLFSRNVHGNIAEGVALIAFKDSLINDDSNNRLQSWNTPILDPCRYHWEYITCNSERNSVVMVDLNNFNLSGPLVPELGQLTNLQYLQLSGNNITGRIPDELGNLTSIRNLDLSFNQLHGAIPNSLGKLSMLLHLLLNNNTLTGSVPVSLKAINTLEFIDISNNNLSGDVLLNGSFSQIPSSSFAGNPNLRVSIATHETPTIPRSRSPSVWSRTTTAIAIGTCVGVVILVVL